MSVGVSVIVLPRNFANKKRYHDEIKAVTVPVWPTVLLKEGWIGGTGPGSVIQRIHIYGKKRENGEGKFVGLSSYSLLESKPDLDGSNMPILARKGKDNKLIFVTILFFISS